MPFRLIRQLRTEPLEQQARGREPCPSPTEPPNIYARILALWARIDAFDAPGKGRSEGSYTAAMRQALTDWCKENGIGYDDELTFEYRLFRRKRIMVAMKNPRIYHRRKYGNGSKGFVIEGDIISIDGMKPQFGSFGTHFSFNRIIKTAPAFKQLCN